MKTTMLCLLALVPAVHAMAQVKPRTLKKTATLSMPATSENGMSGSRGASVAWHPVHKQYYAAMAGNSGYPLAVFNAIGKRVSDDDQACLIDVRGLWYNPATKSIQGNAYDKFGWFAYQLNAKGQVTDQETLFEGMNQPTDQSIGAYNPVAKKVYFIAGSQVAQYDIADASASDNLIAIHFGRTAKQGALDDEDLTVLPAGYNTNTLVYTGLSKASLGFLNTTKKQIELYNPANGFLTQVLKLPAGAAVEEDFCFAYTNGIYWPFDRENRIWNGYK